jgi:hypothetical protein
MPNCKAKVPTLVCEQWQPSAGVNQAIIATSYGNITVNPGDWIVTLENGQKMPFTDANFHAMYDLV